MIEKKTVSMCRSAEYCRGYNAAVDDMCKSESAENEACVFDILDRFSTAQYGKQVYFQEEDGYVYSRISGKAMRLRQAIDEFERALQGLGVDE